MTQPIPEEVFCEPEGGADSEPMIRVVRQLLSRGQFVQVAGIRDSGEGDMLVAEGVDLLGMPLRLAYHTEDVSAEEASQILRPLPVPCVLITYLTDAQSIVSLSRQIGAAAVQIHGEISLRELREFRRLCNLPLIKSLIVRPDAGEELFTQAEMLLPYVDAFITDTYDPGTGACGATGRTHDWQISRRLVRHLPRPIILAGGLTPDNVAEAIHAVCPAGVDVHTGVEDRLGGKSRDRVRAFVREAKTAFDRKG